MLLIVVFAFIIGFSSAQSTAGNTSRHPCDRKCVAGQRMSCYYRFTFNKYFTMSKKCQNCPLNVTSCYNQGCTTGTGFQRIFYPVNLQMPGPLIAVCEFDDIVVDVNNHMGDMTTSIHWHGIVQKGTQYQDGVPYITQCPILPYVDYRYYYPANQSGTQFWHSHSAYQSIDGPAGALIIRQPPGVDPNYNTYDYDLSEHAILITDWHNITADALHGVLFQINADSQQFSTSAIVVNGRSQGMHFGSGVYTPVSSFTVKKGFRYRFRLISSINLPCPVVVSVDNHLLTIIATDGYSAKPAVYSSFVVYPGERYDFVINANKTVGNYWIRFQGNGSICETLRMGANLKYEGAANLPLTSLYKAAGTNFDGRTLNTAVQLNSNIKNVVLSQKVDVRFYLAVTSYLDFNPLDLPWIDGPTTLPLINGIHLTFPSAPLLSQYQDVNQSQLCNETSLAAQGKNCTQEYCSCVYRLKIPLNAETEVVLINTGNDPLQHDFHLHGHSFYVTAQGTLARGDNTIARFKQLDSQGNISRKLTNPVRKDSVGVLQGGYTVFRFKADNPGFWMFHCHVAFHLESGMGLIFQVGEPKDVPPVPAEFPKCKSYTLPKISNLRG
ncbi:hypothetical protein CHUAL_005284 [Chamberlinius hualienensis]